MKNHLSRNEIRKDTVQGAVEATATAVGQIATILTTAVRDVAGAIGGLATEVFELRDAAKAASDVHTVVEQPDPPSLPKPSETS